MIKSGDPFGLFEISKEISEQNTLLVLPHHYKIHHFALPIGYFTWREIQFVRKPLQ